MTEIGVSSPVMERFERSLSPSESQTPKKDPYAFTLESTSNVKFKDFQRDLGPNNKDYSHLFTDQDVRSDRERIIDESSRRRYEQHLKEMNVKCDPMAR